VWPILVVTAFSFVAARVARADATHARAHYDKGRSYFEVGEYRKALEEFQAAHLEKNDVAYIYNIAECHLHLGDPKQALVFYRRFIRLAPSNHPALHDAERHVEELESATAAVPPHPAGGQAVGPPPAASPSPGPSGGAAPSRPAGAPATAGTAVALAPPASTPPPAPPAPAAVAPPGAPVISAPADIGPREGRGGGGSRRTIAAVIGVTGLAALAAGGYFGLRARSKWNDSGPRCPQDLCDDVGKALTDDARTSARLSDVGFGVGLIAVGVAAYLYLASR
jgi:tetratricopeptide (TPR) repeat protein